MASPSQDRLFDWFSFEISQGVCFNFTLQSQPGRHLRHGGAAQLFQDVKVAPHLILVRAKNRGGVFGDEIRFKSFEERLIEGVPAGRVAGFDDLLKSAARRFAIKQRFARAQAVAHDFRDEQTAVADTVDQSLADNIAHGIGQALSQLLFFFFIEHSQDTVDRLAGINCVQGGQDKVSSL